MLVGRMSVRLVISVLAVCVACEKKPTANEFANLNHQLFQAVDHRDLQATRRLLAKGANIETTEYNEMTPLGAAASNGDLAMVQFLLSKGASARAKDHSLQTPLTHAAYGGHAEVVRLLLERNPDLNERNEALLEAAHGEPAIVASEGASLEEAMSAFEAPWVETVKLLLDNGANIEATDEYRGPPLVDAAGYAQTSVVRLLLDRGANLRAKNKYGSTALIVASCNCAVATMNDAYDVVKLLLEKGSNVNDRSNDGATALIAAAEGFGGSVTVKLLLDNGADPRARDSAGKTALQYAVENNRQDKAQLIRHALSGARKH